MRWTENLILVWQMFVLVDLVVAQFSCAFVSIPIHMDWVHRDDDTKCAFVVHLCFGIHENKRCMHIWILYRNEVVISETFYLGPVVLHLNL